LCRNGYGPETITFDNLPVGTYTYWVVIYTGQSFDESVPTPTVELYTGNTGGGVFRKFTAPIAGNNKRAWHVFNIVVADNGDGCVSVTLQDVNVLKDNKDDTETTPVSKSESIGQRCESRSSVCNKRVTGEWKTCGYDFSFDQPRCPSTPPLTNC